MSGTCNNNSFCPENFPFNFSFLGNLPFGFSLPEIFSFLSSLDIPLIPSQILIPPKNAQPSDLVLAGIPISENLTFNKLFNLCWISGTCRASYSFLADGLSRSVTTIKRDLKDLFDNNLIDKKHYFEAPNGYWLKFNPKIIFAALQAGFSLNIDGIKQLILKHKPDFKFAQNQQMTDSQCQMQNNMMAPIYEQFLSLCNYFKNCIEHIVSEFLAFQSNIAAEQAQSKPEAQAQSDSTTEEETKEKKPEAQAQGDSTTEEETEEKKPEAQAQSDSTTEEETEEKKPEAQAQTRTGEQDNQRKSQTESTANPLKAKISKPNSRFINRFRKNMEQVESHAVTFAPENAAAVKNATDEEIDAAFDRLWASYPSDRVDDGDYELCKQMFREMCRQGRIPDFSIFFRYLEHRKQTDKWRVTQEGTHRYAPTLRNYLISQEWGTKVNKIANLRQAQAQAQAEKINEIAKRKEQEEQKKIEFQAKQEFFRNNKNTIEAINENLAQKFDFVHLNITTSLVYSTIQNYKCSLMQILDKATSVTKGQFSNLGKFFESLKVSPA